jgi:hypothetical protein
MRGCAGLKGSNFAGGSAMVRIQPQEDFLRYTFFM